MASRLHPRTRVLADRRRDAAEARRHRVRLFAITHRALADRMSESTAAAMFCVPLHAIRMSSRGYQPVARARQAGMYLAHIVFSANLTRAGAIFGRDRTTARHACATIEDLRDCHAFDAGFDRLEPAMREWAEIFTAMAIERAEEVGEPS